MHIIRRYHKARWLPTFVALMLVLPILSVGSASAQLPPLPTPGQPTATPVRQPGGGGQPVPGAGSRTFPETGKTVKGRFLEYWNQNGGLAQQGYPISEEMSERSDTNGQIYTVQYFERAVFEYHPENRPPHDVLLQLLGVFSYRDRYGSAGAPNQVPNSDPNSRLFPETGKRMGGVFAEYWVRNGGLAQQGYPISDEFIEISRTDGKSYKVQYFERAVFEYHPENQPPYNVLLSLLGKFRYDQKYAGGGQPPGPGPVQPTPTRSTQPPPPPPPSQPTATPNPCADVPRSQNMFVLVLEGNRFVEGNCARAGAVFGFLGEGFLPGENIGVYVTAPDQSVFGAPWQITADEFGDSEGVIFSSQPSFPLGIWAMTMEGTTSHHKAIGYFKLYR